MDAWRCWQLFPSIYRDKQYGQVVGDGNRFEHVLFGPLVAYELGKTKLTLRYLQDVRTRNDVNVSFLYASVAFRL